ncbi:arginase family protein [Chitinophaga barathri]|uniref:Arginase family protein n=1 Tax=Chitinophaga barathri TaxID=1647451 RepID=A0A3N4MFJ6_9BACT|nr:arginase family protein [Chitinophaga barathri]RPD42792.1 arginase family protein [Chitinophaga barathri]
MLRGLPEILLAPSILGLSPAGTQLLGETLLKAGLAERLGITLPVVEVPTLNHLYSRERDPATHCLNVLALQDFSATLRQAVTRCLDQQHFPLVLGGDCSILLGIMSSLKKRGRYGLVFMDAHADFYEPEKSTTGEEADMDLALVTGRGPEELTDMEQLGPYVQDELVIHLGQRDQEETIRYGSQEIRDTAITCISFNEIQQRGIEDVTAGVLEQLNGTDAAGYWLHYDADVLSDDINPAVDYRLPGGLSFAEAEHIISRLLPSGRIAGISITVFNPALDKDRHIGRDITDSLARAFRL